MPTDVCDWTLDFAVRCRISILEARLMTARKVTVIAGKNGCGKSQLLTILGSYLSNTGERWLQDLGFRTYFRKDRTCVSITGPKRVQLYNSARTIARDRDERVGGPYSFDELLSTSPFNHFLKFRRAFSKLVLDADPQFAKARPPSRVTPSLDTGDALSRILAAFTELFPCLRIEPAVDNTNRTVSLFAKRSGMSFVRPEDPHFGDPLSIPFGTLSDGELNTLFFLYECTYHAAKADTPLLLLVDEIENHCHPALASRFIHVLEHMLPPWAMLIATTHSPSIIAGVEPASRVVMVHSSEMDKGANQLLVSSENASAARILHELYGTDSRINATALLRDLDAATSGEVLVYARQCMREAHALGGSAPADPQRAFLAGVIHRQRPESGLCRILDIGAGQGRLIQGLRQDIAPQAGPVLVFDAVEPKEECQQVLRRLSDDETPSAVRLNRVYGDAADVPSDQHYDLILFHNVVHELPADRIVSVFGCALERLDIGGAVNVLEQAILPFGEKQYFVFTASALAEFFSRIGLRVTLTTRASKSGVPLYEITATKVTSSSIPHDAVRVSLIRAVEATVDDDSLRIATAKEDRSSSIDLAFRAFNVAHGVRLMKTLREKD